MEQLRETLKFEGATIDEITLQPTEKEPKAILVVSAALTPAIAEILECREMFFDGLGTPRQFEGSVGLPHLLKATVLTLEADTLIPDLVHKFRVSHESDIDLGVSCRIHLTGAAYLQILLDFFTRVNKEAFDLELQGSQGELFPSAGDATAEPGE